MRIVEWEKLRPEERQALLCRPALAKQSDLVAAVAAIKDEVRQGGDAALFALSERFDNVKLTDLRVRVDRNACAQAIDPKLKAAIDRAYANIYAFHFAQKAPLVDICTQDGVRCQTLTRPIESVGLYAPGGTAPLLSSALMLAIPAKIAGCKRVVLCTPAPIADALLYAAALCEVDEVYALGGAQAIFAMAYGTKSVAAVDKIFGPGNAYVTEAKRQANQSGVAIDMPAGPSEVLVVADKYADADFVASDLLSQAEHGKDSQAVLVSDDRAFVDAAVAAVERQLPRLSRAAVAKCALERSFAVVAKDLPTCMRISNAYAPEHLIIQTQNPRDWLDSVQHAGSVFLGAYSPESVGDYASGTNHVLPTYGFARTHSALGLGDFQKRMSVQELSADGFLALADTVVQMASAEGLDAHKEAVAIRLKKMQNAKTAKEQP